MSVPGDKPVGQRETLRQPIGHRAEEVLVPAQRGIGAIIAAVFVKDLADPVGIGMLRFAERHENRRLTGFYPVDEPVEALERAFAEGIEGRVYHRGAILRIVRNIYK